LKNFLISAKTGKGVYELFCKVIELASSGHSTSLKLVEQIEEKKAEEDIECNSLGKNKVK
jgi:hypothetical protein